MSGRMWLTYYWHTTLETKVRKSPAMHRFAVHPDQAHQGDTTVGPDSDKCSCYELLQSSRLLSGFSHFLVVAALSTVNPGALAVCLNCRCWRGVSRFYASRQNTGKFKKTSSPIWQLARKTKYNANNKAWWKQPTKERNTWRQHRWQRMWMLLKSDGNAGQPCLTKNVCFQLIAILWCLEWDVSRWQISVAGLAFAFW